MFLWLQDCVFLRSVRLMINDSGVPALHLKCHMGSQLPFCAEGIPGVLHQEQV